MLYKILGSRPFWMDQLRLLCGLFKPLPPLRLESLPVPDLQKMAMKPYNFERAVLKRELRNVSPIHLKPDLHGEIFDAKVVPGGQWIVTTGVEHEKNPGPESLEQPLLRLWKIAPPIQKNFTCAATIKLPVDSVPFGLCLQHGDTPSELLLFVGTDAAERCVVPKYLDRT